MRARRAFRHPTGFVPGDIADIIRRAALHPAPPESPPTPPAETAETPALTTQQRADLHQRFFKPPPGAAAGGTRSESKPPWIDPPPGAEPFDQPGVVGMPVAGAAPVVVVTFRVRDGWDGVIKFTSHNWTGPGFVQGSGNILFQITRNGQPIRNYDAITVEFGTPTAPRQVPGAGIRVYSGETIAYVVTHVAGSPLPPAGTWLICFLAGYFYPIED